VPSSVLQSLSHQLAIHTPDGLQSYRKGEQREEHAIRIRKRYGYRDITARWSAAAQSLSDCGGRDSS
jgi:hypothetical protein